MLLCLCSSTLLAQDFSKFEKASFINSTDTIHYRILYPEQFDSLKKYPVVIFLHGSGERGSDNEKQLVHGGNLFLKPEVRSQFPAIVIFPQCPENDSWTNAKFSTKPDGTRLREFQKGGKPTKTMHALLGMTENLLKKPFVEPSQVYVGGLSMGGMGTYEILRRKPKMFAAALAICGADAIGNVRKYKNVPLWIFHGAKDEAVEPAYSIAIANQLKLKGKEVKFSYYPEDGHNSWDSAFAEPELLPWLFSKHKN